MTRQEDGAEASPELALGRVLWEHEFRKAEPDATAERKRDAWKVSRQAYRKLGRQLHARLARRGFVLVSQPAEAGPRG